MRVLNLLLAGCWMVSCGPAAAPPPPQSQPTTQPGPVLQWHRPRFPERLDERLQMVATQMQPAFAPAVDDPDVLQALRDVPRHRFVPASEQRRAYDDTPLPIGHGQTISQPYIVGLMTQLLRVRPGHKVLEIGTGSGYQAAVLAELTPYVYTIEIVDALGKEARQRLTQLGYKTIRVKVGDGYFGWPEHGPYDAIIVTCAATHVPRPLFDQLKPGGFMCIPVGQRWGMQRLYLIEKTADGAMRSQGVLGVAFVPLTGGHERE